MRGTWTFYFFYSGVLYNYKRRTQLGMGVFLNVSHGSCKRYQDKSIPKFTVPENTVVVLMQNRHDDDKLVRQNGLMLGEITRAPSSLQRNLTATLPVHIQRDIIQLLSNEGFQKTVLSQTHQLSNTSASVYWRYQFKTFTPGSIVPNLDLTPVEQQNPYLQGMNALNVSIHNQPRSILTNSSRQRGYTLQELVEYGRNLDEPRGQYTLVVNFSCQEYVESTGKKKRKWTEAFLKKIKGKSFSELFYGSHPHSDSSNYNQYNRGRTTKTQRVTSHVQPRVATRRGATTASSSASENQPLNMNTLNTNILTKMMEDLKINQTPSVKRKMTPKRKKKAVYENVVMEDAF